MTKSNALSIASPRCNLQVYQLLLNLIGFCCDYAVLMHKATHGTARHTSVNWLKPTTSSATAVYTLQPVVQPRAVKCTHRVTSLAANPLRQHAAQSDSTEAAPGCKGRSLMSTTVTPLPIGERSIVMSVSVCVFVCPRSYLRNYTSDLHQIFVRVML